MRVIGQWDSLIQLLTTESAQELMGNSLSRLRLRGSAFNILVKEKKKKKKQGTLYFWWIACRLNTFLVSVQKAYYIIICLNHERVRSKYWLAVLSIKS